MIGRLVLIAALVLSAGSALAAFSIFQTAVSNDLLTGADNSDILTTGSSDPLVAQ